jgi:hypothetical protein
MMLKIMVLMVTTGSKIGPLESVKTSAQKGHEMIISRN